MCRCSIERRLLNSSGGFGWQHQRTESLAAFGLRCLDVFVLSILTVQVSCRADMCREAGRMNTDCVTHGCDRFRQSNLSQEASSQVQNRKKEASLQDLLRRLASLHTFLASQHKPDTSLHTWHWSAVCIRATMV